MYKHVLRSCFVFQHVYRIRTYFALVYADHIYGRQYTSTHARHRYIRSSAWTANTGSIGVSGWCVLPPPISTTGLCVSLHVRIFHLRRCIPTPPNALRVCWSLEPWPYVKCSPGVEIVERHISRVRKQSIIVPGICLVHGHHTLSRITHNYSSRTGNKCFAWQAYFSRRQPFVTGSCKATHRKNATIFLFSISVNIHSYIGFWYLTGCRSNCWHLESQYVVEPWYAYRTGDKLVQAPALRRLTAACPPQNKHASLILSVLWVCILVSPICTNAVPAHS